MYVVPASGGEPRALTTPDEDGYKEGLSWHPDGTRITYMRYVGSDSEVREVSVNGGPSRLLVNHEDSWDYLGNWAPDGRTYVFVSYPGGNDKFLAFLDPGIGAIRRSPIYRAGPTTGALAAAAASWSRDAATLAWTVGGGEAQLWLMEEFE